jgi:hypothetical protein
MADAGKSACAVELAYRQRDWKSLNVRSPGRAGFQKSRDRVLMSASLEGALRDGTKIIRC